MKPHIQTTPADRKRKLAGFIPLREADVYSIRLHVVAGDFTAAQLTAVAHIAAVYGTGEVHLTTRQGVEIPSIPASDLDAANRELAEAGLRPAGSGPWLRGIIACPGVRCRNGLIKTHALANALYDAAGERKLPHKFKIAITGCPNDCASAKTNDFGVTGILRKTLHPAKCTRCEACVRLCPVKALSLDDDGIQLDESACVNCGKCVAACKPEAWEPAGAGYRVTLGAKGGRAPLAAHVYPHLLDTGGQVVELLHSTLDWYTEHGKSKERFGATLSRVGWEKFLADTPPPPTAPAAPDRAAPAQGE